MTPALPLALVLTGLLAALFHLVWGQREWEVLAYWALGLLGFGLAQWLLGDLPGGVAVGTLALLPDLIGALCGILVANTLKL